MRGAFNVPKAPYVELTSPYGKSRLSPSELVFGGLAKLDEKDAQQFFQWVNGFPAKALQIYPSRPVRNPQELALGEVKAPLPLLGRLYWLSTFLQQSREPLVSFLRLSNRFEQEFLKGQFEEAKATLDEIEAALGLSVWLIETRIALLQRWKGLEAQKEYARSLTHATGSKLAGVAAYWVSQRNEENTVFARFRSRLERSISTWKVKEPLKDAYSYFLGVTEFAQLSDTRASSVVGALGLVSLVDAYTIVVAALETLAAHPRNSEDFPILIAIAQRLPAEDFRVGKLLALLTEDIVLLTPSENVLAERLFDPSKPTPVFSRGSAIDAAFLADRALLSAAGITSPAPAWPEGTPAEEFQELVDAAIQRATGFARRIDQASKILTNLRHFAMSGAVHGLVAAQEPEHAISVSSPATLFYLNVATLHPLHAQVLPRSFAPLLQSQFPHSELARATAEAAAGEDVAATSLPIMGREVIARMRLADGDPSKALDYLDLGTGPEKSEHLWRRLAPLRVTALLAAGRIDEAIGAAAGTCAFDPELAVLLPIRELVDEARLARFSVADKLSLAILLDVDLRRHDDADVFQPLQFAYEDFVQSRNALRPSELKPSSETERAKLIYFLRHVAVPAVMDVSFWLFKRSRDTLTERIAVCSLLAELDPDQEHIYRDEIKDITKILNVEDGLEDVDRSRVFVNLPKLERWAEAELLESFERYKALMRAGGGAEDAGEFDKILKDIAGGKPLPSERFANYPKDEAGELLLDIFNTFTQKYLHDADFGLDAYLSMRIRHGSLAGHIRGPAGGAGAACRP